jgi:succinate dehydrogenase / fumarate reductase flavoprotein subunit
MKEIPGLYCAFTNISEMGSFMAWTQGYMSAKDASLKAANEELPGFAEKDVQVVLNKAYSLLGREPAKPIRASEVQRSIQRAFYKGLHLIRNEKDMTIALNELLRIQKEDLPRVYVADRSMQMNRDWRNAMEVENMLLCSISTAHAALFRKETRPFHYRTDFPVMDNKNWLVNVWVTLQKDGRWAVSKTPVVGSVFTLAEIDKLVTAIDLRKPNV